MSEIFEKKSQPSTSFFANKSLEFQISVEHLVLSGCSDSRHLNQFIDGMKLKALIRKQVGHLSTKNKTNSQRLRHLDHKSSCSITDVKKISYIGCFNTTLNNECSSYHR